MKIPDYTFPLSYQEVLKMVNEINPITYKKTRNKLFGSVTMLSPYITRGVITLPEIKDRVLEKFDEKQSHKFIQELAWREYYQSVWRAKGDEIFSDLRFEQPGVTNTNIAQSLVDAKTGVDAIDSIINGLYDHGYIHNHSRMGIASIATNLAHSAWWHPSQWMYYHLLDGDLASNSLSWQWVAGSFRKQPYTTSQSLINYSTESDQKESILSYDRYDMLEQPIPDELKNTVQVDLKTSLPESDQIALDRTLSTLIYHPWHLDPTWHSAIEANRILIIEPSHYKKFPVSEKVMNFIVDIARENIENIAVYVGEYSDLVKQYDPQHMKTREYPAINHWNGIDIEARPSLFPATDEYHKSFYSFWKAGNKALDNE